MTKFVRFTNGKLEITAIPKCEAGPEAYENLNLFIENVTKLFESLDASIGLKIFFQGNANTILAKKLDKLFELYGAGDNVKFQIAFGSLLMLANDLEIVKAASPRCFKKFKKILFSQKKSTSWEGHRFEVRIWASFWKKRIPIINREKPDLLVEFRGRDTFIEAATTRVDAQKNRSHLYRVHRTIKAKNKKKYANSNTALFIDITNLMHLDSQVMATDNLDDIIREINQDKTIKYGVVILFCYARNPEKDRYESIYKRVILDHCDANLRVMIDQEYPQGRYSIDMSEVAASC